MTEKQKRCITWALTLGGVLTILGVLWHTRYEWGHQVFGKCMYISGALTTVITYVDKHAGALGVLFTILFGLIDYRCKQVHRRNLEEIARAERIAELKREGIES